MMPAGGMGGGPGMPGQTPDFNKLILRLFQCNIVEK